MKESSIKSYWFNRQDPRLIHLHLRYDDKGDIALDRASLVDRINQLREYDIDVSIETRALEDYDSYVRGNRAA